MPRFFNPFARFREGIAGLLVGMKALHERLMKVENRQNALEQQINARVVDPLEKLAKQMGLEWDENKKDWH
jgi:hypothetical protein